MGEDRMTDDSGSAGGVGRYLADRFEWAAPGDQQQDAWIVRFCDKDCREAIFTGPDAEREAWDHYNRYAPAYNLYVFRLARLAAPAEMGARVEAIAAAIGQADDAFGYRYSLTSLVDGAEEHTLFMDGFEPVVFEDREDGYRVIAERRNRLRAKAVIAALSAQPTGGQ